jgi:transcriptional regulator with XRE-family HTH domain
MDKKTFSIQLGLYLKHQRKAKGMSQSDLSAVLGNNFQNVSAMERGEFTPTIHTVLKIAEAYGMSLSEFIIGFESFLQNVATEDNLIKKS